ncbi:biliverdin-producing heme oxygenase, partial [Xanthomonas sp. Kuri4-3]
AALDRAVLNPAQEQAVVAAACQAFDRVRGHVEACLPTPA